MDYQISGGLMGEQLIQKIKLIDSAIQIIVITKMTINLSDYNFASKLIKAGASWYCTKYPGDIEDFIYQPTDFVLSVFNAYEKSRLERERIRSLQKIQREIDDKLNQKITIGESSLMTELKNDIEKLAQSDINILIKGSSGTGKELVAHNIHYKSNRKFENLVIVNCGSLPEQLVESELFGYEKGAFTGAEKKKVGLMEVADGGILFLDELSSMPLDIQGKLLRAIEEQSFRRVGGTALIKVDIQVLAASNRNLMHMIQDGKFREDLYYRLKVVDLHLPALRDRKQDIPDLVGYFIRKGNSRLGMNIDGVTLKALQALVEYSWPGNIRELANVMERTMLFCDDPVIDYQHLPPDFTGSH
jgi:transcriptional regulator with PAS, ATPase and Fis domain